ncbi:MAG: hypothetical protein VCA34_00565, partial [Roseibacillus sp.]
HTTQMNYVNKAVLAMMLSASVLGVRAQSEHGDPYEPVGDLTVTPTIVQPGVHPQMFWNIEYPEVVEDLVDVGDNSEVYTNKNLRVQVRMAGVAFQSGSTPLPTALWIRVGGGSWQLLFYGRHYDVIPPNSSSTRRWARIPASILLRAEKTPVVDGIPPVGRPVAWRR